MKGKDLKLLFLLIGMLVTHGFLNCVSVASAQDGPTVRDPNLTVRAVVTGLTTPVSMAFLGPDDFLVLEKNTGKVQRIKGGALYSTVLDLAVNFASERGLLGVALHPDFPENPGVYLYWTESTTGADSSSLADVPLLGNRVDRFAWDGSQLTFEKNIIMLRALQADEGQPLRGNHDGGVIRFEERKSKLRDLIKRALFHKDDPADDDRARLFIVIGDNGRRGQLQNLPDGPFGPGMPDDQFGGPEPDNSHLTGVILRLNDDGTTPEDNPFFEAGAAIGGEAGANIQKIYAYGVRNSFGMAVDPFTGELWTQENGDDSFDEINRVEPGMNGGWVQVMGPVQRIGQFKEIETSRPGGLQQLRWPPENIADTPEEALARLFVLPGSRYIDPEFSWKFAVAPAGIGFMSSLGLGPKYIGDLFVGAARTNLADGYLFRFKMTGNRKKLVVNDPRLLDRVADNLDKFDITESESLLFGEKFGIGTDIQTGPNGNLFVVSLSNGAVYEIFRRKWREK